MKNEKNIYAAMLLFQFRVVKNKTSNKRRICEERIIHFHADSPKAALHLASKRGEEEEFDYKDGEKHIWFEFIGVSELIDLLSIENDDEVWSRFIEKVSPMERKDRLIPYKNQLSVFKGMNKKIKL
ncbi:DUF4288 domain-containing protein [Candidatus Electrothrix sp.]|uniref:DUF4288 domain-containing protein n=1 Tax=Candidatus Electrothrix sp. TaxID=2170559 RepID=UPI004056BA3A